MFGHKWFLQIGELSDSSIQGITAGAFELLDCQYGFYQGVDDTGRAQTNVRLAGINLVYDGLPSQEMIKWAMSSNIYYSGALVLYDSDNMPVEKLFFEDGACTHMRISYVCEGESYVSTLLTLHPRMLKMGDETVTQPWTISDVATRLKKSLPPITQIAQPFGTIDAHLMISGTDYELSEFEMTFHQSVDHKGQPVEDIRGGIMSCSISQMPSQEIKKWAFSSDGLKDGEVHFRQGLQNMPLRIEFMQALCVNMMTNRNVGGEIRTQMTISSNEVILNGKSLFKNWRL